MTGPAWPVLPEGGAWAEAGRTEYTLGSDGTETLATWAPGAGGELELSDVQVGYSPPKPPGFQDCRVYWGSHGCNLERGHQGGCRCDCCTCRSHPDPDSGCVAKPPYYGPETRFYGEDVRPRGLPEVGAGD